MDTRGFRYAANLPLDCDGSQQATSSARELGNDAIDQKTATDKKDKQHVYKALLESLTFPREDARLRNVSPAHRETCLWVFEQTAFKDWRDISKVTDHHGFLWIKGKPGSGKSTIMKTAYDRARKNRSREVVIAYFFNARASDLLEKSSLGMYRSLVHQLLKALPYLKDRFVKHFLVKEKQGAVDEWTIPELQDFLVHIAENLGKQPLTAFIDALDEGEEDDVRQMVAFLEELGRVSIQNRASFNICLSSRHYPHISIKKGISLIVEDQPGHDYDITTFVSNQLKGDEGSQMEELRNKLCRKASGVFLWVVLVIPILNKLYDHGQVDAMNERLNEIPEKLDDLFTEILARDTENRDKSILLLQWTLFAKRPLSPTELYLAVRAGSEPLNGWNLEIPTEGTIKRHILSCSKGLTEVSKSQPPTVQFIHETVRDFLLQKNGLANLRPTLGDTMVGSSHDQLRESCLRYFSKMDDPPQSSHSNPHKRNRMGASEHDKARDAVTTKFPFTEYAVIHIFVHADAAEGGGVSQKEFLRDFVRETSAKLRKWIFFRNLFQRYKARRYTPKAKLLYIISEQNLSNLVRVLTKDSIDVNTKGERYGNALQAACINGHERTARLLVDAQADVNAKGGEHGHALFAAIFGKSDITVQLIQNNGAIAPKDMLYKKLLTTIDRGYTLGVRALLDAGATINPRTESGRSPLCRATEKGQFEIVQLLLSKGADINAQFGYYGNGLQAASAGGHNKIVELLLSGGANVNTQGGYYGNALQAASAGGHDKTIELLLSRGANVNTQGGHYGNALQAASARGHGKAVELLLSRGANVNAQGGHYGNALHAASAGGYDKIIKLLLDKGANDVNAQGGHYSNALQAASARGYDKIIELLLGRGTNVNAQGEYYGNALQAASAGGYDKIIELLLSRGANVNAQGGDNGNALQAASAEGHDKAIELLLGRGANVNAQGGHYGNALQAASARGYDKIIELLLSKGPNVNAQGGYYGNALQAASAGGYDKIAELLLCRGANVNAQSGHHGSALQAASAGGYDKIIELLLSSGADVNAQGGHYGNALEAASARGHDRIVKLLLSRGANVNAQGGYYGNALQAASAGGYDMIIKLLLNRGANDVNAQGGHYGNALQAALARGHDKIVKLLLSRGANVNA